MKQPPYTHPMTDEERTARIAELKIMMNRITTKDDWCTILSYVGQRAARLQHHLENAPPA